ncbi:Small_nuclear ribonucleoprotein Sm D3 [Hexamita inflata]|uniref:Small nuclear ribonucleoprotein Sm D3 n=1 Tax=Hexamita inflata TaxID=28002 RepID=A0AA86P3P1_9EUKA|nr:Small nuclear ribonucleoprotein Sm D3 [Hexamita inflata]
MTVQPTVQLIFEAKGMTVQIELIDNKAYKGTLKNVDYNLNCELINATLIQTNQKFEQIVIRGSQIKFVKVPDELYNSPIFKQK